MPTLEKTLSELYRLFKLLNKKFYSGKLDQPVIVVQSKGKYKNTLGWCTTRKIWSDKADGSTYYEITITAEFLQRHVKEIVSTLLHEMVHLYNLQINVMDCSRGATYHNTKFKEVAESHGLLCEYADKYGWACSRLTPETEKLINEISVDDDSFRLVRDDIEQCEGQNGKGKKQSSKKYKCPACGLIIRATKDIGGKVLCIDCNSKLQEA